MLGKHHLSYQGFNLFYMSDIFSHIKKTKISGNENGQAHVSNLLTICQEKLMLSRF